MFRPPQSVLNAMNNSSNNFLEKVKTAERSGADQMAAKDPIFQTMKNPDSNIFTPGKNIIPASSDIGYPLNVEVPFTVLSHTVANPGADEVFQRKMELFTGLQDERLFPQKNVVENSPALLSPDPILNTAVPNPTERVKFFQESMLKHNNVTPIPTQYVGARHIQPLFRPKPKIGAERVVNPKSATAYTTNTPAVSNVSSQTVSGQVFKNKPETAFPMPHNGFTTTGVVVKQPSYGMVLNKETRRPETSNTPIVNPSLFNNTSLKQQRPENIQVSTSKEDILQERIGSATPFNNTSLKQQRPENIQVSTSKENILQERIGSATPFNNTSLKQQRPLNYQVNTVREGLMKPYVGNTNAFNNSYVHMNRFDNYQVDTAKENLLQPYAGNTTSFNSTPLTQQRPLNYQVDTAKENLLQPYTGNTTSFNNTPLTQQRPLNYQVDTAKENLLQPYAGNTTSFNNTPLTQQRPLNYQVDTVCR